MYELSAAWRGKKPRDQLDLTACCSTRASTICSHVGAQGCARLMTLQIHPLQTWLPHRTRSRNTWYPGPSPFAILPWHVRTILQRNGREEKLHETIRFGGRGWVCGYAVDSRFNNYVKRMTGGGAKPCKPKGRGCKRSKRTSAGCIKRIKAMRMLLQPWEHTGGVVGFGGGVGVAGCAVPRASHFNSAVFVAWIFIRSAVFAAAHSSNVWT